jgi:hypothetical protein
MKPCIPLGLFMEGLFVSVEADDCMGWNIYRMLMSGQKQNTQSF